MGYQRLRYEDLFLVTPVALNVPLERWISRPAARARCEGCGEEIPNEREVRIGDSTFCRACAGQGYYRVLPGELAGRGLLDQLDASCSGSPLDGRVGALVEADSLAHPAPAGMGQA